MGRDLKFTRNGGKRFTPILLEESIAVNKEVRDFDNAFEKVDILLTPTCPTTAFLKGDFVNDPLSNPSALVETDDCISCVHVDSLTLSSILIDRASIVKYSFRLSSE